MGARADFYVGGLELAQWVGSVAWDGYEWAESPECDLMRATSEGEFRLALKSLRDRDDWKDPQQGWPWPWPSFTTDYAYCFADGGVQVFRWGMAASEVPGEWPNMTGTRPATSNL